MQNNFYSVQPYLTFFLLILLISVSIQSLPINNLLCHFLEMSTPGGVTPGRMGADESTRAPTMQYICGECHQEQEIRPKVLELI